ncbi:MAG: hypothetical protein ABIM30_00505 [candidate division WOR-3 bacterium]
MNYRRINFFDDFNVGHSCSWFRKVGNPDLIQNNSELLFSVQSLESGGLALISPQERFGGSNYLSSLIKVRFKLSSSDVVPYFGWLGQENMLVFTVNDSGKFSVFKNNVGVIEFQSVQIKNSVYYLVALEICGDGVTISSIQDDEKVYRLVDARNKLVNNDTYNFVIGCKAMSDINSIRYIMIDYVECNFARED